DPNRWRAGAIPSDAASRNSGPTRAMPTVGAPRRASPTRRRAPARACPRRPRRPRGSGGGANARRPCL
ncbi:MAG: hypothetical protein AVDCRST_MAG49-2679, partial [uncultured Thermomicrobiales bacterium]